MLRQLGRDLMPARHGLRIPMKQQYRLTLTGIHKLDSCAASTNQSLGKAGEKAHYYLRRSVVENSLGFAAAIEIDALIPDWHDPQALTHDSRDCVCGIHGR
jgi:hypothetical protein